MIDRILWRRLDSPGHEIATLEAVARLPDAKVEVLVVEPAPLGGGSSATPRISLRILVNDLWAVALTVVQMLIAVSGATLQVGLPKLAGNREGLILAAAGRGARIARTTNMLESLVLFAALVLIAVVAGKTNATTLLGAQLFLLGEAGLRRGLHRRHSLTAHPGVARLGGQPAHFLAARLDTGPTPIATGRTAEPAAPLSRSGRIMVHEVHTRSAASSSSLAFSIRWMPACDSM
jgi:uncharacterized MAPEG superfamily protein